MTTETVSDDRLAELIAYHATPANTSFGRDTVVALRELLSIRSAQHQDDDMTEENQRRASPELEAAANAAVKSPVSNRALAEFSVHGGLVGLLARELIALRELQSLRAKVGGTHVVVPKEPTEAMTRAGYDAYYAPPNLYRPELMGRVQELYRAMLRAAGEQP